MNTISWLSDLSRDCSLNSMFMRLFYLLSFIIFGAKGMLASMVMSHTRLIIFRDIISYIISKVNPIRHIACGFSDDVFNPI
jgi:hypothetical protein